MQTVAQRTYPQGGTTGTHVIGYVGDITSSYLAAHPNDGYTQGSQIGVSGIEAQYEPYLRGVDGRQALSVDASGTVVGTLEHHRAADRRHRGAQHRHRAATGGRERPPAADHWPTVRRSTPSTGSYPPAINGAVVVMNPQNGPGARHGLVADLRPQPVGGRHLIGQLHGPAGVGCREQLRHRGSVHPGVDLQARHGHGGAPGRPHRRRAHSSTTRVTTRSRGARLPGVDNDTGCVLHDDPGDGAGTYNVTGALTGVERRVLLQPGRPVLARPSDLRRHADPERGDRLRRRRRSPVSTSPGRLQGRVDSYLTAGQAARRGARGPSPTPPSWFTGDNVEMAFGQGETRAHPDRAGGGLRHLRQRRHPLRTPGRRRRSSTPHRQGRQDSSRRKVTGHVTISAGQLPGHAPGIRGRDLQPERHRLRDFQGFPSSWNLAGKTGTASNQAGQEPELSWFVAFGPQPATPPYLVLAVIDQGGYGAQAAAPLGAQHLQLHRGQPAQCAGEDARRRPARPANRARRRIRPLGTPTTTTTTTPPATGATTTTTARRLSVRSGAGRPVGLVADGDPLAPDRAPLAHRVQAGPLHRRRAGVRVPRARPGTGRLAARSTPTPTRSACPTRACRSSTRS